MSETPSDPELSLFGLPSEVPSAKYPRFRTPDYAHNASASTSGAPPLHWLDRDTISTSTFATSQQEHVRHAMERTQTAQEQQLYYQGLLVLRLTSFMFCGSGRAIRELPQR
eukprot:3161158-Amphidinium_carterae.1